MKLEKPGCAGSSHFLHFIWFFVLSFAKSNKIWFIFYEFFAFFCIFICIFIDTSCIFQTFYKFTSFSVCYPFCRIFVFFWEISVYLLAFVCNFNDRFACTRPFVVFSCMSILLYCIIYNY